MGGSLGLKFGTERVSSDGISDENIDGKLEDSSLGQSLIS